MNTADDSQNDEIGAISSAILTIAVRKHNVGQVVCAGLGELADDVQSWAGSKWFTAR